jgi:hypothetical protein
MTLTLDQPGKPCSDFIVSAEAFEKSQAFLTLNAHSAVKNAIGNKSLEIFKGKYWDDMHMTTTLCVRSGDILLIRAAGVVSCPGLEEQMASLYPTRAKAASISSGVG